MAPPEERDLPEFQGRLGPAPWSGLKLTPDLQARLRQGADRSCKGCLGSGYLGDGSGATVEVCHCVTLRSELPPSHKKGSEIKFDSPPLFP